MPRGPSGAEVAALKKSFNATLEKNIAAAQRAGVIALLDDQDATQYDSTEVPEPQADSETAEDPTTQVTSERDPSYSSGVLALPGPAAPGADAGGEEDPYGDLQRAGEPSEPATTHRAQKWR